MVKSKLYSAMVLAGISWGAAASGCGESRRQSGEAPRDPDGPDASGGRATGSGGRSGGANGVAGSTGGTSGASAGASHVAGSAGTTDVAGSGGAAGGGGVTAGDGPLAGEGGAADPVAGAGGSSGANAGASGTGGLTDAGADAPDPFCDTTWPTTKGNPAAPPKCEDQVACGGPFNDAGFQRWLQCRSRLGEHQCDWSHVTSYCNNGQWACPPEGILPVDCWCVGETPPGWICTENGWVSVDRGAAGAPG